MNRRPTQTLPTMAILLILLFLSQPAAFFGTAKNNASTGAAVLATQTSVGSASSTSTAKVIQTQNYNFRIAIHEITTASAYVYVTPAGNYSFSRLVPWSMSYLSLWGNSTSFSAYGIQESGTFLTPSSSATSIAQSSFVVNTTQLSGASIHGYLQCSYDFSRVPEKTSCSYHETKGITADFNMVWITTGDYLSMDGSTTYKASAQTGLVTLGSYSGLTFGATSTASKWHNVLAEDWKDFGSGTVTYGKLTFASVTYYGAVVQFTEDAASVDPFLQQDNICGAYVGSYENLNTVSCSFPSNVASGDLLIVGFGAENVLGTITLSIQSDSESLSWLNEVTTSHQYYSIRVAVGFWSATAKSTSAESVTVSTSRSDNSAITMEIYDTTGVNSTGASATGSGSSGVSFSTSSLKFDNGLLFGAVMTDGQESSYTAGSGYTILQDCPTCHDSSGAGEYAYATSVSSPTSFPMTGGVNIDWLEVGVNFPSITGNWQYGASMSPTTNLYDAIEMPTSGFFNWNTLSGGQAISFFTSSSNSASPGFAQSGFTSNFSGGPVCQGNKPPNITQVCVPSNSWAMWYEYCIVCGGLNQVYYGNAIMPPSGWNANDYIYFSIAYYSAKGEYSFLFTDTTLNPNQSVAQAVCNVNANAGQFSGPVGAIAETSNKASFGTTYVNHIALWAEVQATGNRNSGNTSSTENPANSSPQEVLTYVYAANNMQLGFNSGTHQTSGSLWSGPFSGSNEAFPADHC